MVATLKLPANINTYTLMPMPAEGVSVPCNQLHGILSIAERDPTYFDLAATHFNSSIPAIIESVHYNRKSNKAGLSHSGAFFIENAQRLNQLRRRQLHLAWRRCAQSRQGVAGSRTLHRLRGHPHLRRHCVWFVLWVLFLMLTTRIGYNRTALVKFEKWRPTVAAIDHESKTIYYIGVRLDSVR